MADRLGSLRVPVGAEAWSYAGACRMTPGGPGGTDDPDDLDDAVRRRLARALRRLQHVEHAPHDDQDQAGRLIRAALGYAKIGDPDTREAIARIYQTVLTGDGLAAAVAALARLFPLSTTADVDPRRFAQPLEAAAYLLVAETLTIVDEQSVARRAHVAASASGANLVVEISYDGADVFGADRQADLARRVEAFGGTLTLVTQPGIGTRIRAAFPIG